MNFRDNDSPKGNCQNLKEDFSYLFASNPARDKINEYFGKVCGICKGTCCSYNTSPITFEEDLDYNLDEENLVILRKGLRLDVEFRRKFLKNVRRSLAIHEKKGFGKGTLKFVERNRYSLRSIIQAYRRIDFEIDRHNKKVAEKDPLDEKGRSISDCFMLIPGKGCVFEDYRPFVCITAFRKCFNKLELADFVEAKMNHVELKPLIRYLKADFKIDVERSRPKFIIASDEKAVKKIINAIPNRETPKYFSVDKLSYYQLVKLADFAVLPFGKIPECIKDLPGLEKAFFWMGVKFPPHVIIINKLTPGEPDDDFNFGLDYVQLFKVED